VYAILHLDPPIRKGQTFYPHIVAVFNANEELEVSRRLTHLYPPTVCNGLHLTYLYLPTVYNGLHLTYLYPPTVNNGLHLAYCIPPLSRMVIT
jgi:hypothetical protein